jgi:amino acid transporter/nucleotide-binding universal stress UspA family protein
MLFGDWGTSRLYVLGLALAYTHGASFYFMLAMSLLLVAVGWAYQVICRIYPDGGGVYSAARHRSQTLAMIGGLLLCADYVVTASLSALDAFHYLDVLHPEIWAAGSIALVGVINYFGPRKAGTLALVVALLTVVLTLLIALAASPYLGEARISPPQGDVSQWWRQFTSLILAISGVEAIANMTGIMVEPIEQTAKKSIWPVLVEIVILNLVLTLAMSAVPLDVLGDGDTAQAFSAHRDDMLRLLASYYIGPAFAAGASLVFAMLLLSAVNTAVTDLVSIQYMMARDRELPAQCAALNRWGMPLVPLVISTAVPLLVVLWIADVGHLADLYAIGVVGAVAINLGSCATNHQIALRKAERAGMTVLAGLMIVVWITIAIDKPHALEFALTIMGVGMTARWTVRNRSRIRQWVFAPAGHPLVVRNIAPAPVSSITAPRKLDAEQPAFARTRRRIMVATRGNLELFRYALEAARTQHAELMILFVRHLAIATMGTSNVADIEADEEAQSFLAQASQEAQAAAVPARCLYAIAWDVGDAILDFAVTYGVDELVLGTSRRGALWQTMKGDVIRQVAEYLPERISLLIHA